MTPHARERCAEMGISTKVAKRIIQRADVIRPGNSRSGAVIATWDGEPRYCAVYVWADGAPLVVTVVFRTVEKYVREGRTYAVVA